MNEDNNPGFMKRIFLLFMFFVALVGFQELPAEELLRSKIGDPTGANFPKDAEGRVYHIGLKYGELANRIVLVGDPDRAKLLSQLLDDSEEAFTCSTNRGFNTYTGTKNGVPISIMSVGVGSPMIDLAIREIRAVTKGPLMMVRLGTCGTPRKDVPIGSVVVADRSYGVTTNYDAYHTANRGPYFSFSHPLDPDESLHKHLVTYLKKQAADRFPIIEASDATTDSFFSSQGRLDGNFDDRNAFLIDEVQERYPETGSIQMETFHLFHLAKLNEYAKEEKIMRVASCAIVIAQRQSDDFLSKEAKNMVEIQAGNACLEALAEFNSD